MLKIYFYCVNFNNASYTLKFLDSLSSQKGHNFEFKCIVIDNSDDPTDSARLIDIPKKYEWMLYLKTPENLGYFGAFNYAFKVSIAPPESYVVICNNDLVVDNNFCLRLSQKNYSNDVFAVCPDVLTEDGFHQNPHVRYKIGWFRRFKLDCYNYHYYLARFLAAILYIIRPVKKSPALPEGGCEVHMGIGACYVLTPQFLKCFKCLNYPHFLYGEEAYFSDQIHSAQGILWFDPDLLVHHAESATLSKVPKRIAYEFSRSGYSLYRKLL